MGKFSQADQWGRRSGPTPEQAVAHAQTIAQKQQESAQREQAAASQNR